MHRIHTLARGDADYPRRFEDLPDPPPVVFYAGTLARAPAVAIVGTRRADAQAVAFSEKLARDLAVAGVCIVSGGAVGIDAGAHRGALLAGARTIVVQAAALTDPYPRSHRRLFEEILDGGGGWISETPAGMPAHPYRFLARNRLIAALADLVVVVQAPGRSGALSTARHARAISRPVLAVPAAPWDPRSEGVIELLKQGTRACTDSADAADVLGVPKVIERRELQAPRTDDAKRVLAALSSTDMHADEIARQAGLPVARVHVALIELAGIGRAQQQHGVWRALGNVSARRRAPARGTRASEGPGS